LLTAIVHGNSHDENQHHKVSYIVSSRLQDNDNTKTHAASFSTDIAEPVQTQDHRKEHEEVQQHQHHQQQQEPQQHQQTRPTTRLGSQTSRLNLQIPGSSRQLRPKHVDIQFPLAVFMAYRDPQFPDLASMLNYIDSIRLQGWSEHRQMSTIFAISTRWAVVELGRTEARIRSKHSGRWMRGRSGFASANTLSTIDAREPVVCGFGFCGHRIRSAVT